MAMADRRSFPMQFGDPTSGALLRGELVVAAAWSPDLDEPGAGNDFRIVALTRPQPADVSHPAVAAIVPGSPTRAGARVAEPAATYMPRGPEAAASAPGGPVLDPALLAALGGGSITAVAIDFAASDLFASPVPRWGALAASLVRAGRCYPLWRAVAIATGNNPARAKDALAELLARTTPALDAAPPSSQVDEVRASAGRLAALRADETLQVAPSEVAEDVYCLRAWLAQPQATAEVLRMRRFLREAVVPGARADLALDLAITREQLSFGALLADPGRLAAMRAAFDYFERRYRMAYERHHRAFGGLGPPLGLSALADLDQMAGGAHPCVVADMPPVGVARCPECGLALTDEPPEQRAADVVARIERALERQQARLATAAVRRILGEHDGGGRLDRFLRVVQASDLAGLANVLDDELATFLRALLAGAPPKVDLAPVLAALAGRFPEVTRDDIDAVAEALRRALHEALDGGASREGSGTDGIALA